MKNIVKSIFVFLLILFAWVLFEGKLLELFDNKILPHLSVEFSKTNTVLFFLIMLLPAYTIGKCFKNRFYIPFFTFLLLSFVVFVYIKYRVFGDYISTPPIIANLGYTDFIIIFLTLFLVSCMLAFIHCKRKEKTGNYAFIPDTPINKPELDILDYSESAKQLAKDLETIQADNSCSIGIIAPWGTGKTSYLNLLEYHLSEKHFITVNFNPRHSYSAKNIQEDFFNELFSELEKYDSRFSSSFKDYLKAINVISDNKVLSFFFNVYKIWSKEFEKEKVNHAIRRLNKRIVVIIEDFDRLLSDEIIEIFKLIDGNASFTNLIFITAYDKKHINEIIGNTYSNENTLFSDKFFTIEIQIPLRPYDIIYNQLLNNLLTGLEVNVEDKEVYQITLANRIDILKKYINTIRDVKRFLNLFVRQYKQVQGEVEFEDYFLLYLMKYKYLDEYLNLYKKEYISTDFQIAPNRYFLIDNLKASSKDILEVLFSQTAKYSLRTINNETAIDIYFHEYVYGGLTLKEMNRVFQIPFDENKSIIDSYVEEDKFKDLLSYLDSRNILTFSSKNDFETFLNLLMYINCKKYDVNVPYFMILKLLYEDNKNQISNNYDYNGPEYKALISTLLKGKYPYYPNNITKGIIIGIINNEFHGNIIFSKEEILSINKSALDNLIENDREMKQLHIDLLYSCISEIHQISRIVSLDREACGKVKQLIEEHPSGYFDNFVKLGMITLNEDFNSVACEPFWNQIYGNADEFESFIDSQNKESVPNIKLISNFWKLYKNNNYKPIEFQNQGNVQNKIDTDLTNEVDKLNQLLEIERIFDEYEVDRSTTSRRRDDTYYLAEYERLLNQINNIKLYITKTGDIIRKIQTVVSSIQI